ncbi:crossover junction endonuclease MUS81 isoform X2 [Magnolia sinica]|uniref:crossover junction endonuclease MUS81 isoform X2 n=1 Tax=Magnolia sinica TaxID=86752 RepID=UPI0026582994|nr:crossover junction endonuclease MUS81 isoform X2 [Magnolia sinica]
MENERPVVCPGNEDLASYIWKKRQEMADANAISEKIDSTLGKAYRNVCASKDPIKTPQDFSKIKGVGNWTLRLMQGFFHMHSEASGSKELAPKGKKAKGPKRYLPQKNSVAYALLIALYRGTANGDGFMRKQELIDAAEASGLSRGPIVPEKGKGKAGQFGSSPREWYSGWSCMKTLVTKGLIVKSSCPAKYMLTQEGQEAARECLLRSGLVDSIEHSTTANGLLSFVTSQTASDLGSVHQNSVNKEAALPSINLCSQKKSTDIPAEFLERLSNMGYSKEQIHLAFAKVLKDSQTKESSSLWFAILFHLRLNLVESLHSDSEQNTGKECPVLPTTRISADIGQVDVATEGNDRITFTSGGAQHGLESLRRTHSALGSLNLHACTSSDYPMQKSLDSNGPETNMCALAMPPLRFGEKFEDVYDVILILDDREKFAKNNRGSRSRKVIENTCIEFKIEAEVRRLPVGDGIWIARHKHLDNEYVLDFIVERKEVDDLGSSIRDSRYRDQKLRLLRCGLQKLIYLVEGDPNSCEAAESIKTACFTTEILEGFDVHRTSGLNDTLRKYGYLTQAISNYYKMQFSNDVKKCNTICPSFHEFIKKCQDLDKMTISDVFAIQLMQVPQVTEEIALAVLDLYPTILSLARAYALLEGDIRAQEEMLNKQSSLISAAASRNIAKLVWGH